MTIMKGAEIVVDHLVRSGMPYAFGICGHGNVGLLDALYDRAGEITLISPRHEQAAGHMADAYFRVRHQPVATITSCGPGSANMPMSLACAQADSSAFLAITANVPTSQFNRAPFQESYFHHQAGFTDVLRPYVKRSFQPTRVEMLPLAMRQATQLLTAGRPGPVNVDIPYNVFQESGEVEVEHIATPMPRRSGAAPEDIARVADLLLAAERPLAFVGHGVTLAEAGAELTELCQLVGLPVVNSPNGMGTLDMHDPLCLGFIGRNGTYMANEAGRRCDVLLTIGARFDDRSASSWKPGYSWNMPPTRLIQVDIDPTEIGRNYRVELGIVADARTFLRQLLSELRRRRGETRHLGSRAWLDTIAGWRAEWERHIARAFEIDSNPMRPERALRDLHQILPNDGILVCDSGQNHNWFMQFWQARRPQAMLNTWGFAAMGFGVCGVLGAKLAAPDRPCVSVVGDGGFTMAPHVLCTAVEYDIPAIWVVWNDYAWGAIRNLQKGVFRGREIGTSFVHGPDRKPYNPDFAAMARSYGVEGLTVMNGRDLKDAIGKPLIEDLVLDHIAQVPIGTINRAHLVRIRSLSHDCFDLGLHLLIGNIDTFAGGDLAQSQRIAQLGCNRWSQFHGKLVQRLAIRAQVRLQRRALHLEALAHTANFFLHSLIDHHRRNLDPGPGPDLIDHTIEDPAAEFSCLALMKVLAHRSEQGLQGFFARVGAGKFVIQGQKFTLFDALQGHLVGERLATQLFGSSLIVLGEGDLDLGRFAWFQGFDPGAQFLEEITLADDELGILNRILEWLIPIHDGQIKGYFVTFGGCAWFLGIDPRAGRALDSGDDLVDFALLNRCVKGLGPDSEVIASFNGWVDRNGNRESDRVHFNDVD